MGMIQPRGCNYLEINWKAEQLGDGMMPSARRA